MSTKCPRPHWRAETNSKSTAKNIAKKWNRKGYRTRVVKRVGYQGPTGSRRMMALYPPHFYEVQTCGRRK